MLSTQRITDRGQPGAPGLAGDPRTWLPGLLSVVVAATAWQVAAAVLDERHVIASPSSITAAIIDARAVWPDLVATTAATAVKGWSVGTIVGVTFAVLAAALPAVERLALRVAAALVGVPLLGVAPILQVTMSGDGPGVVLAALTVVFTTAAVVLTGLRAAPLATLDVARSLGAPRWRILVAVRLRSAVPYLCTSLRISWPAALSGAIIGEFLGGSQGLGTFMLQQTTMLATAKVWAAAAIITAVALTGVLAAGTLAKLLAHHDDVAAAAFTQPPTPSSTTRRAATGAAVAITVAATLYLLWVGFLSITQVSEFVGRTPAEVIDYFRYGDGRSALIDALSVTVRDVGAGLLVGWSAGLVMALVACVSRAAERLLMPIAIGLNAVPVIAVIPLLITVFGRGFFGVTAIAAVIVFFPTFVLALDRMRSCPPELLSVAHSYAARSTTVLLQIRLPQAMPALAAAARISCPVAVIGALVAQWLASGQGFGYLMLIDSARYHYDRLWAATAIVTLLAVGSYALLDIAERAALARFVGTSR